MGEEFFFHKKLKGGFDLVITFYRSGKKGADPIPRHEVMIEHGYGLPHVEKLQSLLFDFIESYGIPAISTTFYTESSINDIKEITVGTGFPVDGGKTIHFHIHSWG